MMTYEMQIILGILVISKMFFNPLLPLPTPVEYDIGGRKTSLNMSVLYNEPPHLHLFQKSCKRFWKFGDDAGFTLRLRKNLQFHYAYK